MNGVEAVASWYTPTVFFCILNLVIATIFVLNPRKNQQNLPENNQQYPLQLIRAPSLLDRVRSFKFSDPTQHTTTTTTTTTESEEEPPQLTRVPSLLERVKSFKLSTYRSESQPDPVNHTTTTIAPPQEESGEINSGHVQRSKSDSKANKEIGHVARLLKKSFSEKFTATATVAAEEEEEVEVEDFRPATVREKTAPFNDEDDEEVDEKADDFINKFRQQLKLQRLNSIVRYNDMLNRGTGRS